MKLPWQFEEPMGQWRALDKILEKSKPRPPKRVVFDAWRQTRRYLGIFQTLRFVGGFAMEAWA